MIQINKSELLEALVKQNDTKLAKTESRLTRQVDKIYKKALVEAEKEFKALENMDTKVASPEVEKIVTKVIDSFKAEFDKLIVPFQKEIFDCYDEALEETALLVGATQVPEEK